MKLTYTKAAVMAAVLLFLFWHPLTRAVMLAILPLGNRPDDIIVVLLFTVGICSFFAFGNKSKRKSHQ